MRIQIASDLHTEMFTNDVRCSQYIEPTGDYLALVGDIGSPGRAVHYKRYKKMMDEYSKQFKHVFLIAGNHEYYVPGYHNDRATIEDVDEILNEICQSVGNATFLQKKSVLVNGIRVIGATLWSDANAKLTEIIQDGISDYKMSFVADSSKETGRRALRVTDTVALHKDHLGYITQEISMARKNGEDCVVLTHHSPVIEGSYHPNHEGSPFQSVFSTDLSSLIKSDDFSHVKIWAYGHTHYNQATTVGNTIVVANQSGYSFENDVGIPYQRDHCIELK